MMNHHSILNRHQLRRVCLFRCGTRCGRSLGTSIFTPVLCLSGNTVAFAGISIMFVKARVRVRVHARAFSHVVGSYLFEALRFPMYLHTRVFVCVEDTAVVCVHSRVPGCLLRSPALFAPAASCL